MALYPKARYRPVTGLEKDPPITPIGVILHVRAGTGDSLFDYFNGPSGGIESHFYLTYDGKWEQYRDTTRQADANLHANGFTRSDGKLYGFLSVETEGLDDGTWTDVQLAEIKEFLVWAHQTHGIPLRVCPAWNMDGIGYHTMWGAPSQWTPVAKDCPGPNRIKQFDTVLKPWFANPALEADLPTPRDVWAYDYHNRQALSYLTNAEAYSKKAAEDAAAALAAVKALAAQVAKLNTAAGTYTGQASVTVDLTKK